MQPTKNTTGRCRHTCTKHQTISAYRELPSRGFNKQEMTRSYADNFCCFVCVCMCVLTKTSFTFFSIGACNDVIQMSEAGGEGHVLCVTNTTRTNENSSREWIWSTSFEDKRTILPGTRYGGTKYILGQLPPYDESLLLTSTQCGYLLNK